MKKMFEQPTFEVVRMNSNDIITNSNRLYIGDDLSTGTISAGGADRFRDFEDYSY